MAKVKLSSIPKSEWIGLTVEAHYMTGTGPNKCPRYYLAKIKDWSAKTKAGSKSHQGHWPILVPIDNPNIREKHMDPDKLYVVGGQNELT